MGADQKVCKQLRSGVIADEVSGLAMASRPMLDRQALLEPRTPCSLGSRITHPSFLTPDAV